MTNYTLYKHIFPNNKLYFGITCQPVIVRWKKDGSGYKQNPLMWKAIQKYGWDNVKHEILFENLTEEEACILEQKYIEQYQTCNPIFGYNIRSGGLVVSGWHHSQETKKKLSKLLKGKNQNQIPWNRGKKYGKIKVYQYSIDGSFLAEFKSVAEASKILAIPEANIFDNIELRSKSCYGFIFSKIKAPYMLYNNQQGSSKITIYQYDKTGNLINTFISYKAVMAIYNINESNLEDCLNGRQKTTHGFVFSKIQLTPEEVQERYVSKKRSSKYKYLLTIRETNEKILYNTIDELASALNVQVATLRNAINGQASSLHKKYIFEKVLANEN